MFRLLDPGPFEACFTRFMQRFAEALQGVVAIDGKTLRRSFDRAAGKSPLHMLHAWSAEQRLLLGQLAVDGKSNEITAVPKLLGTVARLGVVTLSGAGQRGAWRRWGLFRVGYRPARASLPIGSSPTMLRPPILRQSPLANCNALKLPTFQNGTFGTVVTVRPR